MRRVRNEQRGARRPLGWVLVALAVVGVGCGAQRPTPYVLAPVEGTTIAPSPPPSETSPDTTRPRRASSSAAARRTTTTVAAAAPAPAAAPPTTVVVPRAAAPSPGVTAAPAGRVGNPRATAAPAAPVVPGAPGTPPPPPTTAPAPRVAGPTPVSAPVFATPATPAPTTAPASPMALTAPAGRAVPDGPFDVLVSGPADYVLDAQPASVCTVDAGRVVPVDEGDCRVRAAAPGFTTAETVIRLSRSDQTISWQLGPTATFTYNTVALDLRATSGLAARAVGASGPCRLVGPAALSFNVAGPAGVPQLGACEVTVTVDGAPGWHAATATLTTTTTRAPVTLTFDVPASAPTPALTVRVVLTQSDRSLDTLLAFGVESAGPCSLAASAALVDPSSRTASLRVRGSAPASGWCALRLLTDAGGSGGLVSVTPPGCRHVWIGTGTPTTSKPACPW